MAKLEPGEMWIGELAAQSGVSTATINYYVQEGILPPPRKLNRTRAAYSDKHRRVLRFVKRAQNAVGLSLAQIKRHLELSGFDDEGLTKLESIGSLQPMPAVWGDPPDATIEHFDPLPEEELVAFCDVDPSLVSELLEMGILRPRQPGRFDASDAWLVRTVEALRKEGLDLTQLAYNRELLGPLREMAKVLDHLVLRYLPALRRRDLRVRDILRPLNGIVGYLLDRLHDEDNPGWRNLLLDAESPLSRKRG